LKNWKFYHQYTYALLFTYTCKVLLNLFFILNLNITW
jgi:hypothetical protein